LDAHPVDAFGIAYERSRTTGAKGQTRIAKITVNYDFHISLHVFFSGTVHSPSLTPMLKTRWISHECDAGMMNDTQQVFLVSKYADFRVQIKYKA
jgi:hypothetical protein